MMIQLKEEETNDLTLNFLPAVLNTNDINMKEDCGREVDTIENDIDIKPNATELLRASLCTDEYSTRAQANFDFDGSQITLKNGQSSCVEAKDEDEKLEIKYEHQVGDRYFATKDETKLAIVPPSTELGGERNILDLQYNVPHEDISYVQSPHPHVVMTHSPLCESEERQWHGLTVDDKNIIDGSQHSHIDFALITSSTNTSNKTCYKFESGHKYHPFVSLCKLPTTVFEQDGSLEVKFVSKSMPAPLCWLQMQKYSPLRQCNHSDPMPIIDSLLTRPFKDKSKLLMEKKTCPVIGSDVSDEVILGCPELENDIAGKYLNYLQLCFKTLAFLPKAKSPV